MDQRTDIERTDIESLSVVDAEDKTRVTNVLIVGVGGQGVIMVSKVLAMLCQTQGYQVKQSEVHGMAKRGGGVFSHVRFGAEVWSPTIPMGEADVLVALEWAEGIRWLPYLKPETGHLIADTQRIVPPFACRNRKSGSLTAYAKETPAEILDKVSDGYALDAGGMAESVGNARAANTILLGALSSMFDFEPEVWLSVIAKFVPKGTEEANRLAFIEGRNWVEEARHNPNVLDDLVLPPLPVTDPEEATRFNLEITEAWCKGCDICVKLCPERILELNDLQVVEITDPDACTGCRLCEWLCPDFAISIQREAMHEH